MMSIFTIVGSFVSVNVVAVAVVVAVPVLSVTDAALRAVHHCLDLHHLTMVVTATTSAIPSLRFIKLR